VNASAIVGALAWLGLLGWGRRGDSPFWVVELLFLLAPLVLVPLALALLGEPGIEREARRLQPGCALAALLSFLAPRGPAAAVLAAPWLAFTGLLALHGLARLRRRGLSPPAELAIDAALLFLPIGAGWLVLSRLGAAPLGFEEPIVLLTAVHFHYAAFTALVLIGLAGRALVGSSVYPGIVYATIIGTPLVAAGITASPFLELVGTAAIAVALCTLATATLSRIVPRLPGAPRVLLGLSASSILVSMPLALIWAAGRFLDQPTVALSTMARTHGTANALGFALCGLLGWTLAGRRNQGTSVL
jgi:hypothetical protein